MRRIISASALSFGTVVVFGSIISRYESPNAARKTPIAINNIPNVARIFLPSGVFTDLSESEIPDCISSDDAVLRISLIPFKNFIVDFLFLLKLHRLITIYIIDQGISNKFRAIYQNAKQHTRFHRELFGCYSK